MIVGVGFTNMLVVSAPEAALLHPVAVFVPLIVYVVLAFGLKVKLVPVRLPGFRVYVYTPAGLACGLITVEAPLQITLPVPKGAIVIVGVGLTVNVTVFAGLGAQPFAVPLTVYTVVVVAFEVGLAMPALFKLADGLQV